MAEKADQCAHAGCSCPAPAGGDYSSDYCSLNEDDLETGCGCEHPECQMGGAASQIQLRQAHEAIK